jgi:hypothetical protein
MLRSLCLPPNLTSILRNRSRTTYRLNHSPPLLECLCLPKRVLQSIKQPLQARNQSCSRRKNYRTLTFSEIRRMLEQRCNSGVRKVIPRGKPSNNNSRNSIVRPRNLGKGSVQQTLPFQMCLLRHQITLLTPLMIGREAGDHLFQTLDSRRWPQVRPSQMSIKPLCTDGIKD